ncbi:MAG: protein kinase [Myxococcota bacterium]|nr:protein kinase [Myxococcota bacterium]
MHPKDFPRDYQPLQWLGEGSVGNVWLSRHRQSGGHCAIKLLDLSQDRRGSAERSFNREVRAMASLSHPSLVDVYDFGKTDEGSPFVAMEHVAGESLARYLQEPWSWNQLWSFIDELLLGLGHAHAREIIHRDLKPNNILIVPEVEGPSSVKIVDFGIAMETRDAERAHRRIEGTPAYIAPEAAQGEVARVGPWTDLYSVGVILYELLSGRLPFYGRNLLSHHLHTPIPELIVRSDVEAQLGIVPVVYRLLEKSPLNRYHSVAALRQAFRDEGLVGESVAFPLLTQGAGEEDSLMGFDSEIGLMSYESLDDGPSTIRELVPMSGASGVALFHLRPPPLVGRVAAQHQLELAAEEVLRERSPRVVLVEGAAGLGKSRLVSLLKTRLEEAGLMRPLHLRIEPQTRGDALRRAVLRFLGAPLADHAQRDTILDFHFSDPAERALVMEALWPEEGDLELESRPQIAAELLTIISRGRPFLFWADDAHWSPEGRVLRLIQQLAARRDLPLLLLITLRPTERKTVKALRRYLSNQEFSRYIRLEPIPHDVLAPALSALSELPPGLVELACEKAKGNPLIAVEAVRGYLDQQGLAHAPMDPSDVLRQRIERASKQERGGELRSLLARSTLLGRSFTLKPLLKLAAIGGDPQAPALTGDRDLVISLLDRAVSSGLIQEHAQRFRYAHDLLRVELRNLALKLPNWGALNLATAELRRSRAEQDEMGIEMEMVARHSWAGGEKLRALQEGEESLRRLIKNGLMGNATSLVRRLLSWEEELEVMELNVLGELLLMGGRAADHAGHHAEASKHILRAISLASDHKLHALGGEATSLMAMSALRADEIQEARRWSQESLAFLSSCEEPAARSEIFYMLGQLRFHEGDFGEAEEAFEDSFEEASRQPELLEARLRARLALARISRQREQLERAEQSFRRIQEDALNAGLEVLMLETKLELGLCAWRRSDAQAALQAFTEVRQAARGNLFFLEFHAAIGEAWAHVADRSWDRAQMSLLQAESLRVDVRYRDEELEQLRLSIKVLARHHQRLDLLSQLDRLSDLSLNKTTHQSEQLLL